jgi:hypothetical protein
VNPELFKLEFKRGIEALLPHARSHRRTANIRARIEAPGPEHHHEFLPYFMIFTIDTLAGADCPMVSVSAPMRPVKILNATEKDLVKEAFSEAFPDHDIVPINKALLPGNSAFKVIAIPPGAPAELVEAYKALAALK